MADKDAQKTKLDKKLRTAMSRIQSNMDSLYTSTYFNAPKSGKELTYVQTAINNTLDKIASHNISQTGIANISKLYSRLRSAQGDRGILRDIEETFNDATLMDTVLSAYMENKYLKDLDDEIDVICKYMPKLLEALDTRRDNVLCADNFSKDYISIINPFATNEEISFADRIDQLKTKYDLTTLFEDVYDDTAKYGERFLYIVPYKKALEKMLKEKEGFTTSKLNFESGQVLLENTTIKIPKPNGKELDKDLLNEYKIKITLDEGFLRSAIENISLADTKLSKINEMSLNEASKKQFDRSIPDDISIKGLGFNDPTPDGLSNTTKSKGDVNVPGCIVKQLERFRIVPIYIEDLCLGYYYIEFRSDDLGIYDYTTQLSDPMISMKPTSKTNINFDIGNRKEDTLRYISGCLSQVIDSKFINNNHDLSKEIYMILKHNNMYNLPSPDSIIATFIPPEDIVHLKFKEDPKSHRGISDLERALLPAKLYSSLYVTHVIGIMTRGQDKRMYYVRQAVDTNISKVLLNTINQIKKSNFGMRQIENINTVLNITGRFNDYVIPVGPSGDPPVQFEVMQGQNIDTKTELMTMLEEMAINSTDVPIELIQARQSMDYAIQYTMSSSKFLRKAYKRQAITELLFGDIVTKIYNAEYDENVVLKINLPPPMFLNITNTNQLITNTREHVNSIVEIDLSNDQEDELLKPIYTKKLMHYYLGSYIDIASNQKLLQESRNELSKKRNEAGTPEQ